MAKPIITIDNMCQIIVTLFANVEKRCISLIERKAMEQSLRFPDENDIRAKLSNNC